MTTEPVRVERRIGQRFSFLLPFSLRQTDNSVEGLGFTQDVSSRGVFFFTEAALQEGAEVELTLCMPSEITLGDSMPVRCRGRILRIVKPSVRSEGARSETKIGVAVRFDSYEYLPESQSGSNLARVAGLHRHAEDEGAAESSRSSSILG